MGRQVCPHKARSASQESHRSEADERSHAEEIVGDDEGKVGGEEEERIEESGCFLGGPEA
jgi:hypothetical protein